jgi:hypothetical protein
MSQKGTQKKGTKLVSFTRNMDYGNFLKYTHYIFIKDTTMIGLGGFA